MGRATVRSGLYGDLRAGFVGRLAENVRHRLELLNSKTVTSGAFRLMQGFTKTPYEPCKIPMSSP